MVSMNDSIIIILIIVIIIPNSGKKNHVLHCR